MHFGGILICYCEARRFFVGVCWCIPVSSTFECLQACMGVSGVLCAAFGEYTSMKREEISRNGVGGNDEIDVLKYVRCLFSVDQKALKSDPRLELAQVMLLTSHFQLLTSDTYLFRTLCTALSILLKCQ